MGKKEHIFQAVLFEAILVALSTIAVMFLAHREVGETGALFVMISLLALLWNVVSNWLFDQKFLRHAKRGHLPFVRCMRFCLKGLIVGNCTVNYVVVGFGICAGVGNGYWHDVVCDGLHGSVSLML